MNREHSRLVIAVMVIAAFIGFLMAVLMGMVAIESPEMAKFVGACFGYLGGIVTPIVMTYFRSNGEAK